MKPYPLRREQIVKRPIEEVFAFFEKPLNLARITPDSVGFEILTPPPIVMKAGLVLDYTIKVFGMRVHWTTIITEYEPPHRFTDVQLKGPYEFWHHTHSFEAIADGTLMTDDVSYLIPLGPLGRIVHSVAVKRQLKRIFDYRTAAIEKIFSSQLNP